MKPMPTHIELAGGILDGRRFKLDHTAEDIARYRAGLKISGELRIYGPEANVVVAEVMAGRSRLTLVFDPEPEA